MIPQQEPTTKFDVYHHNGPFGSSTPQEVRYYFLPEGENSHGTCHMYVLGHKDYPWDGFVMHSAGYIPIEEFLEDCIMSTDPEHEYIQFVGLNYKIVKKYEKERVA